MQPSNSSMNTLLSHQQFQMPFDPASSHDDFLEQMLSSLTNPSSPWADLSDPGDGQDEENNSTHPYTFDDHSQQVSLATKFRHNQINGGGGGGGGGGSGLPAAAAKALMLQQQLMLARNGIRAPSGGDNGDHNHGLDGSSSFKSTNPGNDSSVQALFNGFTGSLGQAQGANNQLIQSQNLGGANAVPQGGSTGAAAQPRQPRVRARRGQATDPHSIAERLRRERIAERMKSLQELVPNANKTDKASMLDEIIDYVKFLQLQVKVLSVSRLGGATAVAPLVADMSSQAGGDGGRANRTQTGSSSNNDKTMTVTEHQVAKLMEEDMGSAMQYLQGKGLCLMPISLATAISTATCHSRNPMIPTNFATHRSNGCGEPGGPPSPNMSALSGQSVTMTNVTPEASVKDVDC